MTVDAATEFQNLTIHLNPASSRAFNLEQDEARPLVRRILESPAEQVFKDDDRTRLTLHEVDGRRWVVKHFHAPPFKTRLSQVLRISPAWREWLGAQRLARLRFRVVEPLALLTGLLGVRCREAIVMAYADGPTLAQWLRGEGREADPQVRRDLAERIGHQIGRLLHARIINRDHKAANLILDAAALENESPMMIDPAGLRDFHSPQQALRQLRLLHKTTIEEGSVSIREYLLALNSLLEHYSDLQPAGPRRLANLARRVIEVGPV